MGSDADQAFVAAIDRQVRSSSTSEAVIYVPGYRVTFAEIERPRLLEVVLREAGVRHGRADGPRGDDRDPCHSATPGGRAMASHVLRSLHHPRLSSLAIGSELTTVSLKRLRSTVTEGVVAATNRATAAARTDLPGASSKATK